MISQGEDRVVDLFGERLVVVENHGVPEQAFLPMIVKSTLSMLPHPQAKAPKISHFIKSDFLALRQSAFQARSAISKISLFIKCENQ